MKKHVLKLEKGESCLLIPETKQINSYELLVFLGGIIQNEGDNYATIYVNDQLVAINFFDTVGYDQNITIVVLE